MAVEWASGAKMTKSKAPKKSDGSKLTEHEGMMLALLVREQPSTAYQLYRVFEQSPVSSINTSKGQLYPAIRRLRDRGLLEASKVAGDKRNSEELSVTKAGLAAVRQWLKGIDASHVLLDDPLRTRMLSLDMLTSDERIEWIASAKALVKRKREIVDEYSRSVDMPYHRIAHQSAVEALRAKMEWLDELLYEVVAE